MPVLMLRSNKHACPECNPKKIADGVKLFHVDGDGRKYLFCAKCLGEFKLEEDESIIQTFKMEKEVEVEFVKADGFHCEKSASLDLDIATVDASNVTEQTVENVIETETGSEIDK